jgi:phage-related protein
MEWEILYFSDNLKRAIMAFPAGMQARYIHLTQRILTFGPDLGMPHTRAMGRGLFELRLKSKEGIGRVLYGLLPGQRIMMLHVFVKKSPKTPAKELNIARARLKEVHADADASRNGGEDAD